MGGITNPQAKYLADLQRKLKTPYTGRGMSKAEAQAAIKSCVAEMDRKKARAASSKPRVKRERRPRKGRASRSEVPPTLEQVRSIEAMSERVGVDVRVPDSEAEARFMLDDLRHREQTQKRTAA
jgi:hypothetical protein